VGTVDNCAFAVPGALASVVVAAVGSSIVADLLQLRVLVFVQSDPDIAVTDFGSEWARTTGVEAAFEFEFELEMEFECG
jgi:hypothetical protein